MAKKTKSQGTGKTTKKTTKKTTRKTTKKSARTTSSKSGPAKSKKKATKKTSSKPGLYANIHKAQARAAHGGRKVRRKGEKGAPTEKAFQQSANTAHKK